MNSRQLKKLGVPNDCVKSAIMAIQAATKVGGLKGKQIKQAIQNVVDRPEDYTDDEHFGQLARTSSLTGNLCGPSPSTIELGAVKLTEHPMPKCGKRVV